MYWCDTHKIAHGLRKLTGDTARALAAQHYRRLQGKSRSLTKCPTTSAHAEPLATCRTAQPNNRQTRRRRKAQTVAEITRIQRPALVAVSMVPWVIQA